MLENERVNGQADSRSQPDETKTLRKEMNTCSYCGNEYLWECICWSFRKIPPPTKEWCNRMAMLEGDSEIGAGLIGKDPYIEEDEIK